MDPKSISKAGRISLGFISLALFIVLPVTLLVVPCFGGNPPPTATPTPQPSPEGIPYPVNYHPTGCNCVASGDLIMREDYKWYSSTGDDRDVAGYEYCELVVYYPDTDNHPTGFFPPSPPWSPSLCLDQPYIGNIEFWRDPEVILESQDQHFLYQCLPYNQWVDAYFCAHQWIFWSEYLCYPWPCYPPPYLLRTNPDILRQIIRTGQSPAAGEVTIENGECSCTWSLHE